MVPVQQLLSEALAFHQGGQFEPAAALYRKVLSLAPEQFDALHLLGLLATQTGQPAQAADLIRQAIAVDPRQTAAHRNLGLVLLDLKQIPAALDSFDRAIALGPEDVDAWFGRGNALTLQGQHEDALHCYDRLLQFKPDHAQAHSNRGIALREMKRHEEAVQSYDAAIAIQPAYVDAHSNRADALNEMGRHEAALESCLHALALDPGYASAHCNQGVALVGLGRLQQAMASYDCAIALQPQYPMAFYNRGNLLAQLHRHEDAITCYRQAIELQPESFNTHNNLGNALLALNQFEAALLNYERAIELQPDCADAHNNRGAALVALGRIEQALQSNDKAIGLRGDFAGAFSNRGNIMADLRRHDEALGCYDRALQLDPGYAEAYSNRGNTLREVQKLEAALQSYDKAIELKPEFACAHLNRAEALAQSKRYEESIRSFDRVIDIDPAHPLVQGMRLRARMQICDWRSLEHELSRLERMLEKGEAASMPFPVLFMTHRLALQRSAAEAFIRDKYPPRDTLGAMARRPARDRIRIGYFSSDFQNHAVAYLAAELFELHDRSRFELVGFSLGPKVDDEMRRRIKPAFDQFVEVQTLGDDELARLARKMEIDIAVDLNGFTAGSRTGAFAARLAPIQVNYLGYPGTMGAPYYDYIVADHTIIPDRHRTGYKEKIVRLPHSYQVNDRQRSVSLKAFSRADAGLPAKGFVFCCFNNNYKITPTSLDAWARIMQRVEGSVLWLFEDNPSAARNLRHEAERRGIAAERMVFAGRLPASEHLARHRLADLFIDTLPYNAHTTGSDALWMGLPVLTCMGESFAGRVAASLLYAVGLPELVTHDLQQYEALAIELATNAGRLESIKAKLIEQRETTPLFDSRLFTKHIESAYAQMHRRHIEDLPPDHIDVAALSGMAYGSLGA